MAGVGISIRQHIGALGAMDAGLPAGILPMSQATLQDMSHVTSTTGDVTFGEGEIQMGPNSRVTIAGSFAGNLWVHSIIKDVSGTTRARFLSPTYQPEGIRQPDGMQTWAFPNATGHGALDFLTGSNSACTLVGLQVVDMTAVLAKPAKVVLALGQSLMECSSVSLGVNPSVDCWPSARCLYLPGATYAGRGTTRGQVQAMHVPLQFNAIGQGVSPAAAFAQELMPYVPESHTLVMAAGAWSQTSLVGPDGDWNPAATSADRAAYQSAIDLAIDGMASLPQGSEIIGVLWAQGQGDHGNTFDVDYPPAFAAMRSQMESDLGTGPLPWMILAPPPDGIATYQDLFRETQLNMDQNSGHALAQTGVHTVAHPAGYIEDGTHVTAWGSRTMGRLAARRFVAEGYL
ncbi:sialate O-acetylesterase [Cognatishimia sp.]|uniref:sialate O-acetylesterase n=1 Tax=Cognatishimia sp. TaxID=2211648 RepID=UPI003517429A